MAAFVRKKGSETYVNTETANAQSGAVTAGLPGGHFVVVWSDESHVGGDTEDAAIKAQLHDAAGAKVGGEFLVNSVTAGNQVDPSVAALASGGFVVTWSDEGEGSVKGQMYTSAGIKVGGEFTAISTGSIALEPHVFALPYGGFVVSAEDFATFGVVAQIFDSAGNKVGAKISMDNGTSAIQTGAAGAAFGMDLFVVMWTAITFSPTTDVDVRGQFFHVDGNVVGFGGDSPITTVTADTQTTPDVATLASGGLVAAWAAEEAIGNVAKAQIFGSNGVKIGPELIVNTTAGHPKMVSVTALAWGGFMVAWRQTDGVPTDIRGQLFDGEGNRLGPDFQISTEPGLTGMNPELTTLASGEVAVAWVNDNGDNSEQLGVKLQLLLMPDLGTAGADTFTGTAGDEAIAALAGDDVFRLQDGGDDAVSGGPGDDIFFLIGSLTAADSVSGGPGTDTLVLQGDYVGGVPLTAEINSMENISFLAGSNINFGETGLNRYDYGLTTDDAHFAAGVQARINAAALLEGEDFTFDGSAETDASYVVYGGKGVDNLTGGFGNDIFFFAEERFATGDTVNGGSGYDGMFLRGNYVIDFNAPGYTGLFTGLENLTLSSVTDGRFARGGGSEFDYDITLSDALVGAGQTLTVSGAILTANETMILDAGHEADGFLRLFGGKADDILKGGGQADLLHANLGADILTGNGGADSFRYQSTAESNAGSMDHILDFTPGTDKIELDRIDADSLAAGNQAFAWIGSSAFSGVAGQLRAYEQSGTWFVEGDVNGDGSADIVMALTLQGPTPLGAADFIL